MTQSIAIILPSLANQAPILVAKDLVSGMIKQAAYVEVFHFDEIVEVDFECATRKIGFFEPIDFDHFDIVHTHMLRPDAYIWFWRILKSCKSTKFVSTIHNIVEEDLFFKYGRLTSIVFSRLWRLFWSAQDRLVVLNQSAKKYYGNFLGRRDIEVIHNGRALAHVGKIDIQDAAAIEGLKTKFKIIGCCALLTHRKGIDQIIRVLPELQDYALVIVGDGQVREELEKLAVELNVLARCLFLGFRHNAQSYLPLFDLYVMPSRSEGLPLALLEAAGHKRAIVCSDIDVFKEIFTSEEASFFQLEDRASLKQAIEFAYEKRERLADNVNKRYLASYTREVMAQRYTEFFSELRRS